MAAQVPSKQARPKDLSEVVVNGLLIAPVEAGIRKVASRVGGGSSGGIRPVTGALAPMLGVTVTAAATLTTGPLVPLALGVTVGAPALWRALHGDSFRRLAAPMVNGWWQQVAVYGGRWEEAMSNCGLMKRYGSEPRYPKLLGVSATPYFDRVWMKLLPGQTVAQVQLAAPNLAQTWGSEVCRVHRVRSKGRRRHTRVRLDIQRKDALLDVVKPLPPVHPPDLDAVPVGRTEYGETWYFELLDTHTLIGGATGSGKASVLWSLLRGIAPAIHSGHVELWGIDPKGGQEFTHGMNDDGTGLFTRYEGEGADLPEMVAMLRELVAVMHARTRKFTASKDRKHTPTLEDPAISCLIDELADLTMCSDGSLQKEIIGLIEKILRRGRSVGVFLVMALQNVDKKAIPFRGLIPTGIGLRLDDDQWQVDAVLGKGAFNRGANCLEIPGKPAPGSPIDGRGVAYVTRLGETVPLRVRASYVTDADLAEMAREYPAPRQRRPMAPEDIERMMSGKVPASDAEAVEQEFDLGGERPPSKP